jgi:hypothetical protein
VTGPLGPPRSAAAAPVNQGLVVRLTTDRSVYQPGQSVVMTLTETDTGTQPVTVNLGPSIDGFFVTQNGHTVWASNTGPQPQYILRETIQPGKSITLTARWNGHSNVGPSSTPTGILVVHSQITGAPTVTIQILSS